MPPWMIIGFDMMDSLSTDARVLEIRLRIWCFFPSNGKKRYHADLANHAALKLPRQR
jgi:hypothetical protein